MSANAVNLLGLSRDDLDAFVASIGQRPYRARQLVQWMHRRHVLDFDAMTARMASAAVNLANLEDGRLVAGRIRSSIPRLVLCE